MITTTTYCDLAHGAHHNRNASAPRSATQVSQKHAFTDILNPIVPDHEVLGIRRLLEHAVVQIIHLVSLDDPGFAPGHRQAPNVQRGWVRIGKTIPDIWSHSVTLRNSVGRLRAPCMENIDRSRPGRADCNAFLNAAIFNPGKGCGCNDANNKTWSAAGVRAPVDHLQSAHPGVVPHYPYRADRH